MLQNDQTIPCPTPNCGGKILFDAHELLRGAQFTCPNCHAAIGLAPESKDVVQETLNQFDTLKKDLLQKKQSGDAST